MNPRTILLLAATSVVAIAAFSVWSRLLRHQPQPAPAVSSIDASRVSAADVDRLMNARLSSKASAEALLAEITTRLKQQLERPEARASEAVLTFSSAAALQEFLARAARNGLHVVACIDGLNTVRVRYDSVGGLARELIENASGYSQVAPNFLIGAPATPPGVQERAAHVQVPVGNNLLPFLGITGDTSNWGRGVTIAVLDSGVGSDATFGTGRLSCIDIGLGTVPAASSGDGHGTAVAALAAGMAADARGIAPASNVLSIRVTGDDGTSDTFTVARGILAATDAGAKIINISLGGYGTNAALDAAIAYATEKGAVIVAAAGNDQAARLTWPAADPRVVSVGAVDAYGQQVLFSNSGSQLQVSAPGYGVQTAWAGGARVFFDGTSASAPVVSGAIAAVLSQNPSLSPTQAWQVLEEHVSDAGVEGTDPDYGHGVLNVGWAMARNDPTRADTAVASHYYNPSTEQLQFVVQNRSAQAVAGLTLNISVNGAESRYAIPWLAAGAAQTVSLPLAASQLAAARRIELRSELVNPATITDQVPSNNTRATVLTAP